MMISIKVRVEGSVNTLWEGAAVVGRGSDADFIVNSTRMSRLHARLTLNEDRVWVEDLGSRNGTFINDVPVREKTEVHASDKVRFGDVICELEFPRQQPDASRPLSFVETRPAKVPGALTGLCTPRRTMGLAAGLVLLVLVIWLLARPSAAFKAAANLIGLTTTVLDAATVADTVNANIERIGELSDLKNKLKAIPENLDEQRIEAAKLAQRADELLARLKTTNDQLLLEQEGGRALARTREGYAAGTISRPALIEELQAVNNAYPGTEAAAQALRRMAEEKSGLLAEEQAAFTKARDAAVLAMRTDQFGAAAAAIDACTSPGFVLLPENDVETLTELRRDIDTAAVKWFRKRCDQAVKAAESADPLEELAALEQGHAAAAIPALAPLLADARSRIAAVIASRAAAERMNYEEDINLGRSMYRRRAYTLSAETCARILKELREPQLITEVKAGEQMARLLASAKTAAIDHVNAQGGIALPGAGRIVAMSEEGITPEGAGETRLDWDRLSGTDFLHLLEQTAGTTPSPRLTAALAFAAIDAGDAERGKRYLEQVRTASPRIAADNAEALTAAEVRLQMLK